MSLKDELAFLAEHPIFYELQQSIEAIEERLTTLETIVKRLQEAER